MIIDTHTHFYDINRPEHYWPSKDSDIYFVCLPEKYIALAEPEGVTGTVIVEASPQFVDNEWILSLCEEETFLKGFVGNLPLGTPEFAGNLERFTQNPLYVGIRFNWGQREQLLQPNMIDDLKRLADTGRELDILCGVPALQGLPELQENVPGLRVVINHVAGVRIDSNPPDPEWVEAVNVLHDFPDVFMKVSGLVEGYNGENRTSLDDYIETLDIIWEAFGEDRVIYGSNWPVSARFEEYSVVHRLPTEYLERKSEEAAHKYFYENSKEAYRWPER